MSSTNETADSGRPAAEAEVTIAYFAAMTAAFQVLVLTLQSNGSLKQGEYQEALPSTWKFSSTSRIAKLRWRCCMSCVKAC